MRALPILLVCVAACSAKLDGSISINDAKLDIQSCQSGTPMGFAGVELDDGKGTRLRLVANADGTATAILFANTSTGQSMPNCGTLSVKPQNSKINNVTNVEGSAKLSCNSGSTKIEGSLEFENCH